MDGAIATALAVSMATAAMRSERVVNFTSLLPFRADLDEFTAVYAGMEKSTPRDAHFADGTAARRRSQCAD